MGENVILWQYVLVIFFGWVVAQSIKVIRSIVGSLRRRGAGAFRAGLLRRILSAIWASGGMPSAHTSVVVALALYVGLVNGFPSAIFGVTLCFASIVIYDAMKVRWASGQNSVAINEIIKRSKINVSPVKIIRGHTFAEVCVGLCVGLCVGFLAYFVFGC